ncbi:hypothetical protein O181_053943 [Austropuccinia psidii MF-1]|uniref:Integrase catalytic domain-containing protein n=1 Tax=Austropuccinia psidii MF-1 TaxID=1389203 RepID=A0A9Q3E8D0_9BASI|nr:hypothetical protein [Austropuccinia psidii MF-1]
MPLKEATNDHDVSKKGSQSDLSRVLDAVDALTSKVQSLQLKLDFHKQDNINKSTFDVVLHNRLGRLDSPATFEYVSEAIQAAETAAMSVVPVALIDHDASVSAVRYFPPNSSSSIPVAIPHHFYQVTAGPPNQSPPQHLPDNMTEKAAAFKGRGTSHAANAISKSPLHSAEAWHERLGHGSTRVVREFLTRFVPSSSNIDWMDFFCKQCARSKSMKEKKAPMTRTQFGNPLDLLVSNVEGPFPADPAGNHFLLTLHDHASTFILTAPLKYWKDVPSYIVKWVKFLYGRVEKYPMQLRTDNAGKYSVALEANLWSMGTEWVPVEPYQPDFNGKAERVNRTLGDMERKMLNSSNFPSSFWSYTYSCATKIHNRLPNTRTAPMTPMEQLLGIQPYPAQIYPFGAHVIVHVPSEKWDKLEERRKECVLLTLPKSGHGWIFYDPRTKPIVTMLSARPQQRVLLPKRLLNRLKDQLILASCRSHSTM